MYTATKKYVKNSSSSQIVNCRLLNDETNEMSTKLYMR